ncbi:MAG TPA: hypothetical protein VMX14_06025, partial [Anaerolineae bacterium]|nr:hypothetical protein [Anaerolineae bacterium]
IVPPTAAPARAAPVGAGTGYETVEPEAGVARRFPEAAGLIDVQPSYTALEPEYDGLGIGVEPSRVVSQRQAPGVLRASAAMRELPVEASIDEPERGYPVVQPQPSVSSSEGLPVGEIQAVRRSRVPGEEPEAPIAEAAVPHLRPERDLGAEEPEPPAPSREALRAEETPVVQPLRALGEGPRAETPGVRPEPEPVSRAQELERPVRPVSAPTEPETFLVQPTRVSDEEMETQPTGVQRQVPRSEGAQARTVYRTQELAYPSSPPGPPSEPEADIAQALRVSGEEGEPPPAGPARREYRAQEGRPRRYPSPEPGAPVVRPLEDAREESEAERPYWGPEPGPEVTQLEPHAPPSRESTRVEPAVDRETAAEGEAETEAHYTALTPAYDTEMPPVERVAEAAVQRRVVRTPPVDAERRTAEEALPLAYFPEGRAEEGEARPPMVQRRVESEDRLHFAARERDAEPSVPREGPLPLQRVPLSQALFGAWPERSTTQVARQPGEPETEKEDRRQNRPVPPPTPAMQVNVVRRSMAETEEMASGPGGASSEATGAASQGETGQPDMDELADKVYRRIRERLRLERERFGAFRYR